jgi:hypothetical protein
VVPSGSGGCYLREDAKDQNDHVDRTLTVSGLAYRPAKTGATDQARAVFRDPPGWKRSRPAVPVRGLGEEAKLVRTLNPSVAQRHVALAVRWRNVFTLIDLDLNSALDRNRGRIPPSSEVEAGVLAVARDILAGIHVPPAPAPTAPAYLSGEARKVKVTCDSIGAARRLVPGISRHPIAGSDLRAGCDWSENDGERPDLTVEAEVIPPSAATGETGTRIATTLSGQWRPKDPRVPKLGDEARIDHFTFQAGLSRTSSVVARRGNLLVYVSYGSWNHPSTAMMDAEVIGIAKAVLAG